ncbi:site-specific DNA-methyltransferase [Myxococcus vastator]|uniref:site-specific DNA-methyltransferase n=1 Tax=Myxococcus vastator TaxID=2709664 RepID=UPI001968669C|nr:DNA methyltransferase [Myxococcus vastator]
MRELRTREPALARDLEREVSALADRRAFGLNFERHLPEVVELPGRKVRKGDKVRVLPPRGKATKRPDGRLWRVVGMDRSARTAKLELLDPAASGETPREELTAPLDDLVVVAQSRDPIYPGLVSTGKVERGGDKPFHTVINAENLHALETLLFTHRGKVDCIYIDPPYNTGAKDWKYNNDYVEGDDLYRHSKWLAFMERRLLLAKELLNPDDSALVVTIDEKEYLRLGLLLEQTFPEGQIEMVTSVISSKGVARFGRFSRVEEYVFTVRLGAQEVSLAETNMLDESRSATAKVGKPVDWLGLRRREPTARRGARPKQFYPVFVNTETGYVHSIGDEISGGVDRLKVAAPKGTFAVWPLLPDGTEGLWGITPDTARAYLDGGYFRARNYKPESKYVAIQYLPSGTVAAIKSGDIEVTGRDDDGAVIAAYKSAKGVIPKRVWNMASHNAETGGTNVLSKLLPGRRFPFPKSLFAVEDALRFFVADKLNATVIDFFAGSGTTLHAVMRLNKQDNGRRRAIVVTNNEVGADEQKALRDKGLRPADPEWEELGICDFITKPRIKAAITGKTPDGEPIKGDYKFTDEFPMADGFQENAEFFTLTYEAPLRVASHREFSKIAPLLWMRAGSRGRRIDDISSGWAVADTYGVLADLDKASDFFDATTRVEGVEVVYIVTDEDRLFESLAQQLPDHIEPVRLYESYLRNFEIESGRGAL